jgi:hypothetical protein
MLAVLLQAVEEIPPVGVLLFREILQQKALFHVSHNF